MNRARPLLLATVVAIAALAFAGQRTAVADEGDEMKARMHFAAGEYKQALDLFVRLYAETLHPTYLRNIARCHQNLGDADKAITGFREYLRKAKELTAEQRAEVEGYIAEMEQMKRAKAESGPQPPPPAPPPSAPPPPTADAAPLVGPPTVVGARSDDDQGGSVLTRWWFWAAIGGVAVAGLAAALLLSGDVDPTHGSLGAIDLRAGPGP